jgi:3-vinyl bacteriochlorophyllide hydratase
MLITLAAYATYVVNAAQFLWKLRMARLDAEAEARAGRSPLTDGVAA